MQVFTYCDFAREKLGVFLLNLWQVFCYSKVKKNMLFSAPYRRVQYIFCVRYSTQNTHIEKIKNVCF